MLEIKNLSKTYDDIKVVDDLSFFANKGEILGLLGPNGAGKTTTLEILVGLTKANHGEITLDNISLFKNTEKIKGKIGFVSEDIPLYEHLTGEEYLLFICKMRNIKSSDSKILINDYAKQFDLIDKMNSFISSYSKGMKQKLSIISALIHSPTILILDEPLTGVDPISSTIIKNYLKEYAQKGNIVIFSSHILEMVEKLCDKIILINKGKIVYFNYLNDLLTNNNINNIEELFNK
ncbi:ABC transporter ATP-binding protein [Bacillus cereus]|uniref:ABC transporter n=1 Tax=Bacillus cereus TaxID=1396 RepID=A0A2A7I0P5_BACCE|nr:ABC transporter ATP-binding protein [Bacillus cereus]PEC22633.1 ABC transporter [Bacillus cereus]